MRTIAGRLTRVVTRALDVRLSGRSALACGAAVGLVIAWLTLDPGFVWGTSRYWELPLDDAAQHLAGLTAFARDRWHFPILEIAGFGQPEGANAANLDVIPLLAVPVKLLYPLSGRVFLYFGLWVALCRVLQGALSAALLFELGERRAASLLAVSLLAGGLPSLLERALHEALSSQFLLLLAFLLYLRIVRATSIRAVTLASSLLLVVSLLVHPYLLAMVFPLCAAGFAERRRRRRLSGWAALGIPVAQAAGLLLLMLVCGHFAAWRPRFADAGWTMNLLSPFLSSESTLLPATRWLPDAASVLAPEGTNYLGLGVLLLLALTALSAGSALLGPVRRHPWLGGVLVALALFSLSARVSFAHTVVLSYRLPGLLALPFTVFQGTGRFFWPASLALVVWPVAVLARRFPAAAGATLLAFACTVQWLDLAAVRARALHDTRRHQTDPLGAGREAWVALVARHRSIEAFPSNACAEPGQFDEEFDLQLQLLAVRAGVPINSAYLARPNKDCRREAEQERRALREPVPEGTLRVFYAYPGRPTPAAADDPRSCRPFSRGFVCTRAWRDAASGYWSALPR